MSTTPTRLPLSSAKRLSEAIVAELAPACERIEIAGSIRREKPEVGDIEIVAIPRVACDLLGQPLASELDPVLDALVLAGRLSKIKGGDKYKQYLLKHGVKLDLFLTDKDCWGVILAIRTGPADFSKRLVTQKFMGGLLPSYLRVQGGRIWKGYDALETLERDVFSAAGLEWIEPRDRK